MQEGVGARPAPDRVDALCAALLLLVGASLCMVTFSSGKWGAQPSTEDEFVYLFQAKTLAAGHLTYPSPPVPEFFESAHILVVPRFAAKYLPGHAAVLAPFELAGVPWLGPCLLLGASAALLFLAARMAGLVRPAALVAPALLLGATNVFPFFASYLSQSTSLAVVAAFFVAAIAVQRRPRGAGVAALFCCVAFAALVRPFTGIAAAVSATALLVFLHVRRQVPLRVLVWALPPLVAGALLCGGFCKATTGSWTTPPWSLYARQYMPFDGPGIGAVRDVHAERGFPPHLMGLHDGFLETRRKFTWSRLPAETLRRLRLVAGMPPAWAVIPFSVAGAFWAPLWPASIFALAFFAASSTFHVGGAIYNLELYPWLALAAAAGAEMALRGALRLRRPLAASALAMLCIAALWTASRAARELYTVITRAAERPWRYARWEPAFEWLREQHAVVFVRYPHGWDGNVDLTYNDPDLASADLVRAIDKGERDGELLQYFPDRPAFILDPVTLRAERIR
jgi:hypothetical protein